jgi:glycosyltransferase involved in cell wall biosynthesis
VAAAPHIGLNLLYLAPGETGGMETYARALVPRLPEAMPEARFTAFAGRELATQWRSAPWHPAIRLVGLPVSSATRVVRSAAEQSLLAVAALRRQIEVLHSLGNVAPLAGPPSVVTVHDLIYRRHPETTSTLLTRGAEMLVPAACRRARRIIVPSQATENDLRDLLGVPPQKIDVVPEGPGLTTPVQPTPGAELRTRLGLGDGPLVLSVSARRPHKNLSRLIAAMAAVPGATLVLPGYASAYEEGLRADARVAGVADRVAFVGWVSDADLEGLYAAAVCLVFPSLAEGFGLPVLEAMARGVPVACSGVSAMPEVAGDAALLFDPASTDAIAGALRHLLEDPALRARLAERGRARAATFSWERAAQGTAATYRRALGAT